MRLDKFLTECGLGSRREVKKIIDNRMIKINEKLCINGQLNINPDTDIVEYNDNRLNYKKFRYYVLNKKAGYITAVKDDKDPTVMELLPEWVIKKDLAPVGRLDKDTEGILLFTNDGKLAHSLLHPKKHIDKTYYVELEKEIGEDDIKKLENGVMIGEHLTNPAKVDRIREDIIHLTIDEGKFHQVKKMMISVGNKVKYLKRIKFGKLELKDMELGEVREIELEDIQ